ncbi:MAG: hypothetical protein CMM02_05530 [Rhodopirellula sp.]|nr:hypothetical protein [Rhodopirellula sp.]|tara:strand:+ start:13922 stop:14851 length:930 start_codon:yes stop_codon:yes gene_type:complete
MKIGILEPDNFNTSAINFLQKRDSVKLYDGTGIQDFLIDLDALFIRLKYKIDSSFLKSAQKLKYICSPTTGHTHIDEKITKNKNIKLITLRGEKDFLSTIRATPEHTFGLILSILRNYKECFLHTQSGGWDRDKFRGEELFGNTVGIIGLGRVGFQVAEYCESFGAKVSYYDIYKEVNAKNAWTKQTSVLSLIKGSRIIVLCASFVNGEKPILNRNEIDYLENKFFVNTARGELVDEGYLIKFIKENKILGIGIDVIFDELNQSSLNSWVNVARNRNVSLTPHIGGATDVSMHKTELFIAQKLIEMKNQ